MRWKECFSKPPQTPLSPSHLLGNDQERGVSVCSLIKNRWILSAANLLVIGDSAGEAAVGVGGAEDTKVKGGSGVQGKGQRHKWHGLFKGLEIEFRWSKLFSPSFPISAPLKDLNLA